MTEGLRVGSKAIPLTCPRQFNAKATKEEHQVIQATESVCTIPQESSWRWRQQVLRDSIQRNWRRTSNSTILKRYGIESSNCLWRAMQRWHQDHKNNNDNNFDGCAWWFTSSVVIRIEALSKPFKGKENARWKASNHFTWRHALTLKCSRSCFYLPRCVRLRMNMRWDSAVIW